eukprot:152625-Prorocentrum_minimum.AAC.1
MAPPPTKRPAVPSAAWENRYQHKKHRDKDGVPEFYGATVKEYVAGSRRIDNDRWLVLFSDDQTQKVPLAFIESYMKDAFPKCPEQPARAPAAGSSCIHRALSWARGVARIGEIGPSEDDDQDIDELVSEEEEEEEEEAQELPQ